MPQIDTRFSKVNPLEFSREIEKGFKVKPEQIQIFNNAILKWGADKQIKKAAEECAELIQALLKGYSQDNINEEIADVEIMIFQLKMIMRNTLQVDEWKQKKIRELGARTRYKPRV